MKRGQEEGLGKWKVELAEVQDPSRNPNLKETFSKLLGYLRPYRLQLGVVIVFAIGSAAFSIVGPKILGEQQQYI